MKITLRVFRALCLVLAITLATGCKTVQEEAVVPAPVVTKQDSFDGNVQNSGIIDADAAGFHVTQHYSDRWDALVLIYGGKLVPPRAVGDRAGITPEPSGSAFYARGARWIFTAQTRGCFGRMNAMRKAVQGSP